MLNLAFWLLPSYWWFGTISGGGGGVCCLPVAVWWSQNQVSVDSVALGGCAEKTCYLPPFPPLYPGTWGLSPFLQFQFSLAQVPRSTVESPDHWAPRVSSPGPICSPASLPSWPHCPDAFYRRMVGCAVLWAWTHTRTCFKMAGPERSPSGLGVSPVFK